MDLAYSAIQRDLNELKSIINIPQNEGMTKSIETTSTDHVDPNKQKEKAALLSAIHCTNINGILPTFKYKILICISMKTSI